LGIMGVAALVSPTPITVPPSFLSLDLPVMVITALLLSFFVWRRRLGRVAGIGLVLGYGAYMVVLFGIA